MTIQKPLSVRTLQRPPVKVPRGDSQGGRQNAPQADRPQRRNDGTRQDAYAHEPQLGNGHGKQQGHDGNARHLVAGRDGAAEVQTVAAERSDVERRLDLVQRNAPTVARNSQRACRSYPTGTRMRWSTCQAIQIVGPRSTAASIRMPSSEVLKIRLAAASSPCASEIVMKSAYGGVQAQSDQGHVRRHVQGQRHQPVGGGPDVPDEKRDVPKSDQDRGGEAEEIAEKVPREAAVSDHCRRGLPGLRLNLCFKLFFDHCAHKRRDAPGRKIIAARIAPALLLGRTAMQFLCAHQDTWRQPREEIGRLRPRSLSAHSPAKNVPTAPSGTFRGRKSP